jgi:sugar phosphate isomerase/epimerase
MPLISVQLFTLKSIESDAVALDAVAGAGYEHVELFGAKLALGEALAEELSQRGLKASGSHVALADLVEDMDRVVANARAFGIASLFVPSVPPPRRDMPAEGWRELGKQLAELAEGLERHGISLGYHNHDWDLRPKEGSLTPLDLIFDAAGSAPVQWEADIAWLTRAGVDPLAWLTKYSDRLVAAHVKDLAPAGTNEEEAGWANVGAGVLDWKALWPGALAAGAKVMVVEHDRPLDPARTVEESLRYIRETLL